MNRESENYSWLLQNCLGQLNSRIEQFTDEQWVWQPTPAVPSAKMLALDALHWLFCDRQHIIEPDAQFHEPQPKDPETPSAMASALSDELKEWVRIFLQVRVEDLDAPRRQFNSLEADNQDVRWMMLHALLNSFERLGEITTLGLALGHAGTAAYVPNLPHDGYKRLRSHGPE